MQYVGDVSKKTCAFSIFQNTHLRPGGRLSNRGGDLHTRNIKSRTGTGNPNILRPVALLFFYFFLARGLQLLPCGIVRRLFLSFFSSFLIGITCPAIPPRNGHFEGS